MMMRITDNVCLRPTVFWLMRMFSFFLVYTTVVGTSAVVVLSLGGSDKIASMPLSTFFLGSSLVSATLTPWIFDAWGRKNGFFTGIALGLVGTVLSSASVALSSPGLYIVATAFFGMATGLGFALRFAAVEVVPAAWASRAVTLVVSGGVMAAFAGPEASAATRDVFGDDLTWMGAMLMTGVFGICNLLATALVTFPKVAGSHQPKQDAFSSSSSSSLNTTPMSLADKASNIYKIIGRRQFWVPMLVATVAWAAMGMPMSLVRVAMAQLGYTSRDSLRVVEIHFMGMYAPGFFTGSLIKRFGPAVICYVGVVFFVAAQVTAFFPNPDESDSIWLWAVGLALVGIAWNFCFTASTVWLVQKGPKGDQRTLQAANDCLMFLLAGGCLFAASYIYDAGSSNDGLLDGWYTLNWVVIGLNVFMAILLIADALLDRMEKHQSNR